MTNPVIKIVGSEELGVAHITLADGNTQAAKVTDPRGWPQLVLGARDGTLAEYFNQFESDPEDLLAADRLQADDWTTIYGE